MQKSAKKCRMKGIKGNNQKYVIVKYKCDKIRIDSHLYMIRCERRNECEKSRKN